MPITTYAIATRDREELARVQWARMVCWPTCPACAGTAEPTNAGHAKGHHRPSGATVAPYALGLGSGDNERFTQSANRRHAAVLYASTGPVRSVVSRTRTRSVLATSTQD